MMMLLTVQQAGVSRRCVFREIHAINGFTEFRSAAKRSWYVGFNRRGRRLPGAAARWTKKRRRRRRCYQFTKTDFPYVGGRVESQQETDSGDFGSVDWYSWIASRRRTGATAVT